MAGIKIIPTVNSVSPSAEQVAADTVDGFHASQTAGANEIPVKDSSGDLTLSTGNIVLEGGKIIIGTVDDNASTVLANNPTEATVLSVMRGGGTDANTAIRFKNETTSFYIGTTSTNTFGISYNSANITAAASVIVTSTGNVLIGTTTDAGTGKLQITGDIVITAGTLKLPGTATTASANAGSNGDVPTQVAGYLVVNIGGDTRKIPYYAE